jgi:hypothetical protein
MSLTNKEKLERLVSLANSATVIRDSDLRDIASASRQAVHIAIMRQPYLDYVLSGRKTIESRLTQNRMAPFQTAHTGDLVLFKESGGPIRGLAIVAKVEFFNVKGITELVGVVADRLPGLAFEAGYLESKLGSKYVSFLYLEKVAALPSFAFAKRSRQSWVTINPVVPSPLSAHR